MRALPCFVLGSVAGAALACASSAAPPTGDPDAAATPPGLTTDVVTDAGEAANRPSADRSAPEPPAAPASDGAAIPVPDGATVSPDARRGAPVADASNVRDGSVQARDASAGGSDGAGAVGPGAGGSDAGTRPYKGVANSPCADLTALGSSWFYNWTQSAPACKGSEFVPMVWGHPGNEQSASGIASAVDAMAKAGHQNVLGFNEPDNATQANLSVGPAIALWPFLAHGALRVGSPATQANTTGLAWFANGAASFMGQVNADATGDLRVDFISAHWYGWNANSCEPNAATLEAYIRQIEAIPGARPIWLTELGCLNVSAPTAAVVQSFLSGAIAMLARHPRVERYAWYPWVESHALVRAGALTPLGAIFAAAPSYR